MCNTHPVRATNTDPVKSGSNPVVVQAKTAIVQQTKGTVCASKTVTVRQKDAVVHANQICFDSKKKHIVAKGNVCAEYKTGDSVLCDCAKIDVDLKNGSMHNVRSFMADGGRGTASMVTRQSGVVRGYNVSYTPCDMCKDQLEPVWSIHSNRIDYNEKSGEVHYEKPQIKIFGRTVFSLPSIRSLTQRSSGLLSLDTSFNQELGVYGSVPVYWAMRQDCDMTITPYLMSKAGFMTAGQFRHAFHSGQFFFEGAINVPTSNAMYRRWKDDNVTSPGQRGFVHSKWDVDIDERWRFRSDMWWAGDKTFLSTRPFFGNATAYFLTSNASIEGFFDHGFARGRTLFYQDMAGPLKQDTIPCALPELSYYYHSPLWGHKFRLSSEYTMLNLYRRKGVSMARLAVNEDVSFVDTMPWGQTLHGSIMYRGAFYRLYRKDGIAGAHSMDNGADIQIVRKGDQRSRNAYHYNMMLCLESRYPLMNTWGMWTPVVQFIATPKVYDRYISPNEDSQVVLFDDRALFEKNRFMGYDRVDRSTRVNYGYEWSQSVKKGEFTAFMGQSFAMSKPDHVLNSVGVRKGLSDVVAKGQWSCDASDIACRVRCDKTSLKPYFYDAIWSFGPERINILGSYQVFLQNKNADFPLEIDQYQQLYVSMGSKIGDHSGKIFCTHNLGRKARLLDYGMAWEYNTDSCLVMGFNVQQSFYKQGDMVPGLTIGFYFHLKKLGGVKHRPRRFVQGI